MSTRKSSALRVVGVNGITPRVSLSDGAGNGMGAGGTFVDTEVDGGFRLSELPPLADDGAGDCADKGELSGEEVACELDMFVVMVAVVKLGSSRVSP